MHKFEQPIFVTRPIFPDLGDFTKTLEKIWSAQWMTNNGPQHQLLECRLPQILKVPNLSLFNNGTIALMVACKLLRLKGEVITTPFTFPATAHALTWNNITPVFCDIDPVTMNIDPKKIESLITSKTTGIMGVHIFGTPCDVEKIQKIADKHNLKVIYDAAHAFGVEIDGEGIGNFGDISMFSFHATKLFHTAEGGALAFKDEELKKLADLYRNFGIKNEEEVVLPGINGKMNELQAATGLLLLDHIEDEWEKREVLLDTYRKCLKNVKGITLLDKQKGVKTSNQYFVIRIDEKLFGKSRDYAYEKFKEYNIFTRKYFDPICSEYPHYKDLPSADKTKLPVANKVANEVLSMPFYGGLSIQNVEQICNILKNFR